MSLPSYRYVLYNSQCDETVEHLVLFAALLISEYSNWLSLQVSLVYTPFVVLESTLKGSDLNTFLFVDHFIMLEHYLVG